MVAIRLIHSKSKRHTFMVMVDDEDRDMLLERAWSVRVNPDGYRVAISFNGLLHRLLLGAGKHRPIVDHINMNSLDNRRENLRLVTSSQNRQNVRVKATSQTGIKGVCWEKGKDGKGSWRARVTKEGVDYKKRFSSMEAANQWVRKKREEIHGEYHRHA